MSHSIKFRELRQLLLDLGFHEATQQEQIIFAHEPSDTIFVFRPYRPGDLVTSYNLIEVQNMLHARGILSAESFDNQFKKAPA